jgi:hypothetical protein
MKGFVMPLEVEKVVSNAILVAVVVGVIVALGGLVLSWLFSF